MRRLRFRRPSTMRLLGGCFMTLATCAWSQPSLNELDLRVTEADIAPQVRVRDYENRTVEEFSINNNVYMVRITDTDTDNGYG